ncbi:uncharacterized protein [Arachis hypogaea]|uniref:uncharacterized protein isoform X2 n=1 Tax=Arachis hypogaea TaxID=3818 RepID=UPI000A2C2B93|nr:uncharacterized protein LOC112791104 isoform X2 [Arachis hypogaea]
MVFEDFEPIFAEPKVDFSGHRSCPLSSFLLHAYAPDTSHIVIHVTDFHSHTWEARFSVPLLEDIRDIIGIGGSWSEFVDYFVASLKSEDLKLVLEANSSSDGISNAKLVAQKSKGMPLITIPLTKLVDSTANEAISNISSRLFKAYKNIKRSLVEEQERTSRLTNIVEAEKERNETLRQQLEHRHKFQKISDFEKVGVSTNGPQNSPESDMSKRRNACSSILNVGEIKSSILVLSKQLVTLRKLRIVWCRRIAGPK